MTELGCDASKFPPPHSVTPAPEPESSFSVFLRLRYFLITNAATGSRAKKAMRRISQVLLQSLVI
jgi:hypothetical protein